MSAATDNTSLPIARLNGLEINTSSATATAKSPGKIGLANIADMPFEQNFNMADTQFFSLLDIIGEEVNVTYTNSEIDCFCWIEAQVTQLKESIISLDCEMLTESEDIEVYIYTLIRFLMKFMTAHGANLFNNS